MKTIFPFLVLTFLANFSSAEGLSKLVGMSTSESADGFKVSYTFSESVSTESVSVDFKNESIVLEIPNVEVEKKVISKVESAIVKSVIAENADQAVKSMINYRGVKAKEFKDNVSVEASGNSLTFIIKNPAHIIAKLPEKSIQVSKALPSVQPEQLVEVSANSLSEPASAQQEIESDQAVASKLGENTPITSVEVPHATKSESDIPVLAASHKVSTSAESPFQKILLTVVAIGIFGLGTFVYIKRNSQKSNKENSLMKIKMITQYHLSPKKSLAVVRVAGESILIGISENNISVLKTLSLLDEELPEVSTSDFSSVFNGESLIESARPAKTISSKTLSDDEVQEEFAFGDIKDRVTKTLKNRGSFL